MALFAGIVTMGFIALVYVAIWSHLHDGEITRDEVSRIYNPHWSWFRRS